MADNEQVEPKNALHVWVIKDLTQERDSCTFEIVNDGQKPRAFNFDKRKRQVIETLMRSPVYCASPVRISDVVHILKRDNGLEVETRMFPGNPKTGSGSYGIYILKSKVTRLEGREVAA